MRTGRWFENQSQFNNIDEKRRYLLPPFSSWGTPLSHGHPRRKKLQLLQSYFYWLDESGINSNSAPTLGTHYKFLMDLKVDSKIWLGFSFFDTVIIRSQKNLPKTRPDELSFSLREVFWKVYSLKYKKAEKPHNSAHYFCAIAKVQNELVNSSAFLIWRS